MNLFKRKTKVVAAHTSSVSTVAVKPKKKEYPVVVQEIHNEFMTAGDRILANAKTVIAASEAKDLDKGDRLSKLGFTNATQAVEARELKKEVSLSKENSKLVMDYRLRYPNYKFITEEQVEAICLKYNLVCGDISKFKGFVPEKNLKELEAFTGLKDEDVRYYRRYYMFGREKTEVSKREYEEQSTHRAFASDYVFTKGDSLQICAPIKDMDTKGMELDKGYKLKKHIPDPVVLQPVSGGYLILTAWGDEASDPMVVNESMN